MRTPVVAICALCAGAACSPPAPPPATAAQLTPTEHLARASLALRGIRPSLAELRARIYSELVAPGDPALDDAETLFDGALAASGDPRRAWTVPLTGMLSDLRALYY